MNGILAWRVMMVVERHFFLPTVKDASARALMREEISVPFLRLRLTLILLRMS